MKTPTHINNHCLCQKCETNVNAFQLLINTHSKLVYQGNVEQLSNLKRHWDIRYVKYAKTTDKHNGERALTLKQEFISESSRVHYLIHALLIHTTKQFMRLKHKYLYRPHKL